MPLTRISITIPEELVRGADAQAEKLDRSRSWVLVEALRRYLEEVERGAAAGRAVRERTARYHGDVVSGLGPYRQAQLEADLALTPEERVREAERTARVSELAAPAWNRHRVIVFDRFEDYLDWDRWEGRVQ